MIAGWTTPSLRRCPDVEWTCLSWREWAGPYTPTSTQSRDMTFAILFTILFARFKCECLKVAVLKNKWLAQHLGGKEFKIVALKDIIWLHFSSSRRHVLSGLQVWGSWGCGVAVFHPVRPFLWLSFNSHKTDLENCWNKFWSVGLNKKGHFWWKVRWLPKAWKSYCVCF